MKWLPLVLLGACVPQVAPPATPPAAPVLDPGSGEQHRRIFNLRGVVAADATVRVFTDSACAGPVYRQVTGSQLAQGVPVELLAGPENVFAANAVSSLGATSPCSAPVRIHYVPAVRPARPSLASRPDSPSRQTHFAMVGSTDLFARVRLHEGACSGPALAELSGTDFYDVGFGVDVPVNGWKQFAVDAVNEDETSDCAVVSVANDRVAPIFTARLGSPTPSPQQRSWVVIEGETAFFNILEGSDCSGPSLQTCSNCVALDVEFPPDASTSWGVYATDRAGNGACVRGDGPWVHDPSLPADEAMVLLAPELMSGFLWLPRALVPLVERGTVEVFRSADCSGPIAQLQPAYAVAWSGIGLPSDSPFGLITARSVRRDGGVDPCSNAVLWQP